MIKIFFYLLCLQSTQCQRRKIEGFILEGQVAEIEAYPHSAHLQSYCERKRVSVCGSSVLNQLILITAAHCLQTDLCTKPFHIASFGNTYKSRGTKIAIARYIIHENYLETNVEFDIAVALLARPITLGKTIARIAINKTPVENGMTGDVAGWGYVLINPKKKSDVLRYVRQTIISREICGDKMGGYSLPNGTFCAQFLSKRSFPTGGDSGSALIINDYVQVGVVSFKIPKYENITVYTDISYFYDWIETNAFKVVCLSDFDRKKHFIN